MISAETSVEFSVYRLFEEYRVMRLQAEKPRQDIYETITSKLLAAIESGPGGSVMPWQRGGTRPVLPTNAVTGKPYRGVNILSLWVTALDRGYDSGEWATYKQWGATGCQVRKGEKGSPIVFYKEIAVSGRAPNPTALMGKPSAAASHAATGCSPPSRWKATYR
jgi:antirestriction protein ArdC